jgi:predicted cupin superfamily sugar epimerase
MNPDYWIKNLGLLPHPEGGYYKETYRSVDTLSEAALEGKHNGPRNCSTAIYFLITKNSFSAFHKILSDELWHFYAGDPLEIFYFNENKELVTITLGKNPENSEVFQAVVPKNRWFGSRVVAGGEYSLLGCTVAPGFDFNDFEMAERSHLLASYPEHSQIITDLTR